MQSCGGQCSSVRLTRFLTGGYGEPRWPTYSGVQPRTGKSATRPCIRPRTASTERRHLRRRRPGATGRRESERHVHLRLAETSPADKATITVQDFVRNSSVSTRSSRTARCLRSAARRTSTRTSATAGCRDRQGDDSPAAHGRAARGGRQPEHGRERPDLPVSHDADGLGPWLSRRQSGKGIRLKRPTVRADRGGDGPAVSAGLCRAAAPAGQGLRPARGVDRGVGTAS